tara:strand:+ start:1223 stop:1747 length:525 start_codon:yes stop_codon:yes gene_type:complete
MHDLIKNGKVLQSRDFGSDDAPKLSENKGEWFKRKTISPEYNPETQISTLKTTVTATGATWEYVITDRPLADRNDAELLADNEDNQVLDAELRLITSGYSDLEVITWGIQLNEATSYLKDNVSPTPFIDAVLAETGEDKIIFVEAVIEKAAQFAPAAGAAVGRKRKKRKARPGV